MVKFREKTTAKLEANAGKKIRFAHFRAMSTMGKISLAVLLLIAGSWLIRLAQIYAQNGMTDVSFSLYNMYYPTEKISFGNMLYSREKTPLPKSSIMFLPPHLKR